MKKILCILCLLLALVCVFVACEKETPTPAPHTHTFGAWSESKAATCSAKGEEKRTCACGESETREIATFSHAYGEWITTTPATCGTKGIQMRVCGCGASAAQEIPSTGAHVYNWQVTTPATCANKGVEVGICVCSESVTREIAATGLHALNEQLICEICDKACEFSAVETDTKFLQFKIKNIGSFIVELYPQYAPQTVENFQKLVSEGFYNGLTFHRIYKDFMIQGGAPKNGISADTIQGEFASNGFIQNTLKHERGVISMARANDPNSASSQFFIMHADALYLDGNYAAFGRVVFGMNVIDTLANLPVTYNWNMGGEMSKPLEEPVIESITFVDISEKDAA